MRLNVNHVVEIYVTEQRQRARVEKSYQERHAVIFRDFNMAGCAETETYWQTNGDSETYSDDIEIVEANEHGECGEHVTCRQTNDDSDTSVHDKYIAAAILETQKNDEFDDASRAK